MRRRIVDRKGVSDGGFSRRYRIYPYKEGLGKGLDMVVDRVEEKEDKNLDDMKALIEDIGELKRELKITDGLKKLCWEDDLGVLISSVLLSMDNICLLCDQSISDIVSWIRLYYGGHIERSKKGFSSHVIHGDLEVFSDLIWRLSCKEHRDLFVALICYLRWKVVDDSGYAASEDVGDLDVFACVACCCYSRSCSDCLLHNVCRKVTYDLEYPAILTVSDYLGEVRDIVLGEAERAGLDLSGLI
jgi:hypothetical protein